MPIWQMWPKQIGRWGKLFAPLERVSMKLNCKWILKYRGVKSFKQIRIFQFSPPFIKMDQPHKLVWCLF